jgi:predicted transcriptional regulator
MPDVYLDLTKEVPIPADDDPEVLAAIARGIRDADAGRLYTRKQVEEFIVKWRTKSTTQKKS